MTYQTTGRNIFNFYIIVEIYISSYIYLLFDLLLFRVGIDTNCIEILICSAEEANDAGIVPHWNLERSSSYLTKRSVAAGISDQCQRRHDVMAGRSRKPSQKL